VNSHLLATKLRPPAIPPKRTRRPHLVRRLQDGLEAGRQITLLSAPAGFGKTVCAGDWVRTLDWPVAWLTLDPADDEPQRFFTYFCAALQQAAPGVGEEIAALLAAGQLPPGEIISATLINDLLAAERSFLLICVGVVLALANHSAFSMIRLSDLYAAATTAAAQEQLLAAGEAVIAGVMWHSTSGFLAGIFMQGGFVLVSALMLRSKTCGKGTAVSGLAANGLDLLHVFVGLTLPSLATTMLYIAGVFYLAWFPLLARDLLKRGQE